MKIRENQHEIPEAITRISQSADSIACRESIASVINPEPLRHAPTGTGCDLVLPHAGSDYLKSVAKVYRRQNGRRNPEFTGSSYFAESALWLRRISNQTLHLTAFRPGCCHRTGDARRSVTHPAWAGCAPSLPHIPIYACLPEGCR